MASLTRLEHHPEKIDHFNTEDKRPAPETPQQVVASLSSPERDPDYEQYGPQGPEGAATATSRLASLASVGVLSSTLAAQGRPRWRRELR